MHVPLASRWLPGAVRHPAGNAPFFLEVGSGNGPHHRAGPMLHCLPDTPPRGTAGGSGTSTLSPPERVPCTDVVTGVPDQPAASRSRPPGRPQNFGGMRGRPRAPRRLRPGVTTRERSSPPAPRPRARSAAHAASGRGASRRPPLTPLTAAALHGASSGPAAAGSRLSLSVTRCLALSFQVLPVLLTCQTLEICS